MNLRRAPSCRALERVLGIPAFAGAMLVASACHRAELPPADVIAQIGGAQVHYPDFERYLQANLAESGAALGNSVLSQLFDQFLDERLLGALASDRGVAPRDAPARQAVDALLRNAAGTPTDVEVRAYYEEHPERYLRPERVRVRQILVEDRATAERALHDLARGEDFAAVARRLSRDPSAERGGDQGELGRDDLPAALADVVFALAPGAVSPIVPAEYGFHLFQVVDRRQAERLPFEEAGRLARTQLLSERQDKALAAMVVEARNRYNVAVYARNLPFAYRGKYPSPSSRGG